MKTTRTIFLCLALTAPLTAPLTALVTAPMALAESPPDNSPSLAYPLGPEVPFSGEIFTLISVQGQPAPYSAEISFTEGRVTGLGPCNRYFGGLVYDAAQFRIENVGSTRMACPDLAAEADFFALLQKVRLADRREGHITLSDGEGAALLTFTIARP